MIMVQMFLHRNNVFWKLLDDSEFVTLRNVLDNTMKECCAMRSEAVKQDNHIRL